MRRPFLVLSALALLAQPAFGWQRARPAAPAPAPAAAPAPAPAAAAAGERAWWRVMSEPRLECRATLQYLTWQWTRYAGPGAVPSGSPLNAFTNPAAPDALDRLSAGVSHNPQAAGVYRSCAAAGGTEYLVWLAATASERQCDMAAVSTNLTWQKQNALVSLNEAMRLWQAGRAAKTVAEENAQVLAALRELYTAVRHNATAGSVYRACFRDRPEDFFAAIRLILAG